jgi:hypothetical protein
MADLKRKKHFLFDLLRVSLPAFKDYFLKVKTGLSNENPIGRYVGICNKSEVNMYFKDCIAGGYTGWVQIKLFAKLDCDDYEECAEEILTHEVLHQVLEEVEGRTTKKALDNIHQPFYVYDTTAKKWHFVIEFVSGKIVKKFLKVL